MSSEEDVPLVMRRFGKNGKVRENGAVTKKPDVCEEKKKARLKRKDRCKRITRLNSWKKHPSCEGAGGRRVQYVRSEGFPKKARKKGKA